jgi:hypothetical protein
MGNVGNVLILSAAATMIVGVILIAAVSVAVGGIVILVGIFDLALGAAFRSGMLGGD